MTIHLKATDEATLMQALRDVPQQAGFPTDVLWPTEPGNV